MKQRVNEMFLAVECLTSSPMSEPLTSSSWSTPTDPTSFSTTCQKTTPGTPPIPTPAAGGAQW